MCKRSNRNIWLIRAMAIMYLLAVLTGCSASSTQGYSGVTSDTAAVASESKTEEADVASDAPNTEEYAAITENGFEAVSTNPLSTFSADVDTASYANVRRMILKGQTPPPDAVRIEEMLNYFYYDYPEPEWGEPFSVTTEIADCPWNQQTKILLVGLQAKKIESDALPPSNLVFLLDVSGSMDDPYKLPLMKSAFGLLVEQLRARDRISIVTYASSDRIVLESATGADKANIMNAIDGLTAGGSTAGSRGIITAYELAEKYFIDGGNNRVILGTDGDLNVGITSEDELKRLVEQKRDNGVYLSVMGFGTGNIKDNKMETLADNGNGNYSYVDDLLEAKKVLVEEMGGTLFTVAKDVKFQVEFNPQHIKGYRLIGYENRLLADEDFADDTKDAGEIGAGHRVTALYEIVPVDSPFEIGGSTLKYQQSAAVDSDEWLTVSIRYKQPDGDESQLLSYPVSDAQHGDGMTDNLKLASAIAEYGMLLRGSKYRGTASYAAVSERLKSLAELGDAYIDELVYLVSKSQRTKAGT